MGLTSAIKSAASAVEDFILEHAGDAVRFAGGLLLDRVLGDRVSPEMRDLIARAGIDAMADKVSELAAEHLADEEIPIALRNMAKAVAKIAEALNAPPMAPNMLDGMDITVLDPATGQPMPKGTKL